MSWDPRNQRPQSFKLGGPRIQRPQSACKKKTTSSSCLDQQVLQNSSTLVCGQGAQNFIMGRPTDRPIMFLLIHDPASKGNTIKRGEGSGCRERFFFCLLFTPTTGGKGKAAAVSAPAWKKRATGQLDHRPFQSPPRATRNPSVHTV
jgi:hypothetical protein